MKEFVALFVGAVLAAVQCQAGTKQSIGYLTQYEAWKDDKFAFSVKGEATHLNIDWDAWTIINFSFFGVAIDGSLHSGDYRNKQGHQAGSVGDQQPGPLVNTSPSDSWDLPILWGQLELQWGFPSWSEEKMKELKDLGYAPHADGWIHEPSGLTGKDPIPVMKPGGAPGLLQMAHQKGKKVMASIGGWSMSKHFPDVAADQTKKAKFLSDCKRLMDLGFDGIDIDWEFPGAAGMNFEGTEADYANFEQLMEDIRATIGSEALVTAAFKAVPNVLEGYNWQRLDQSMDYFNMMSYDLNGGWSNKAGHNSPLYEWPEHEWPGLHLDHLTQWMIGRGINSSKINLGAAFYGRGVVTSDSPATLGSPTVKKDIGFTVDGTQSSAADMTNFGLFEGSPNYNFIEQRILAGTDGFLSPGWTKHWDDNAKVPYAVNGNFFLSYDDEAAVRLKAEYVISHNLGGLIVWQIHGDIQCTGSFIKHDTKLSECEPGKLRAPLSAQIKEVFYSGSPPVVPPPTQTTPPPIVPPPSQTTPTAPPPVVPPPSQTTPPPVVPPPSQTTPTAAPPVVPPPSQTTPPPVVPPPSNGTWDPSKVYNGGEVVTYNGLTYTAKWYTVGNAPGTNDVWLLDRSGAGVLEYDATHVYLKGDKMKFNGVEYRAKWWTQGIAPGTADGPWELV